MKARVLVGAHIDFKCCQHCMHAQCLLSMTQIHRQSVDLQEARKEGRKIYSSLAASKADWME